MDTKDKLGGYVGSRRYLYDDDKPTSKKKIFSDQPIKKMADKIVDKNYQQNKDKYRKGGKYYNYVPKGERELKKLEVKRGNFFISFD